MKKIHILICDDEAGVRESLKLILAGEYALSFATGGTEAIEQTRTDNPDLIIMDVKMPNLGGLEALKSIKRIKPSVRILMITGYESSDVAVQATGLGADDYLTKPFERHKVQEKVRKLLHLE